jgi:hypothetical protein
MHPCPSTIREQLRWSPPQTRSTPLLASDQMRLPIALPKTAKNARAKTQPQQQKMSSKAVMGVDIS